MARPKTEVKPNASHAEAGGSGPSRGKRLLFVVLTGCLALLGMEVAARGLEWGLERWLASRPESRNPFVRVHNRVPVFDLEPGATEYVRTPYHWISNAERFAARKTPGIYRVFVVGGSAAAGWPHKSSESFPGLLSRKLSRMLPTTRVEVVNAAGHTYASHRVKLVFDEIVDYEPDLVILYTGNNEFLEDLVYAGSALDRDEGPARLAISRLMNRIRRHWQPPVSIDVASYGQRDQVVNRLSFAFGRASRQWTDARQYEATGDHYEFNVGSMLDIAQKRGVPVLVLGVPVNLRDWRPNVSRHDPSLGLEQRVAWQKAFSSGVLALEAGRADEAVDALERSVAIDPNYAEGWYELGLARLRAERSEGVREAFLEALEHDAYPFRSVFDGRLRDLAHERGVAFIDLADLFQQSAPLGVPGFEFFVDYVHPTAAANERIAHEVVTLLDTRKLLPEAPALAPGDVRIEIPADVEEQVSVLRGLFNQFLVMRQYDHLDGLAQRLWRAIDRELPRATPERRRRLTRVRSEVAKVMQIVTPYRRMLRAERLGRLEEQYTPAEAEDIYRAYAEMIRLMEAPAMPLSFFREFAVASRAEDAER
ncbi:hypothetical protein MK489_06155 [Myxococcota bacterium]|nr:hypothetical protein [Myxococcota bacterium]